MVDRLLRYRVFADAEGRMNLDLRTIDGELLPVSQFTLAASTAKGLRPGFSGDKNFHESAQFEGCAFLSQRISCPEPSGHGGGMRCPSKC